MSGTPRYQFPEDSDLWAIIKELQDRISDLERGTRATQTTIDSGALVVKKNNQIIAIFGDLSRAGLNLARPDGTPQMGIVIWRDTGEMAFSMWDSTPTGPDGYQQFFGQWDRTGHILFSDDTTSGWGIATPWIPSNTWSRTDVASWPPTTSATFVEQWENYYIVQHNKVAANFLVWADAGTVGEARLKIDGVQFGPTISVTGAGFGNFDFVLQLAMSQYAGSAKRVTIEARRVSGAGNVNTMPRIFMGRQS